MPIQESYRQEALSKLKDLCQSLSPKVKGLLDEVDEEDLEFFYLFIHLQHLKYARPSPVACPYTAHSPFPYRRYGLPKAQAPLTPPLKAYTLPYSCLLYTSDAADE